MKISKEEQENGLKLYENLVAESWKDSTFKKALLESPKETIKEFTNGEVHFGEDENIVVVDQTDSHTTFINIPRPLEVIDMELNEEQLEIIAGGATPVPPTPWGVAIVAGLALGGALRRLYNKAVN